MLIGFGMSVTSFCRKFSQPRGGLLKLREFTKTLHEDGIILHEKENIHPGIVGTVVDYLTRFYFNKNGKITFSLSLRAAAMIRQKSTADALIKKVTGLDDASIIAACKLSGYDVVYRAGADYFREVDEINPDQYTIENIRVMVERSITYLKAKGNIESHITFEGGYNKVISTGDADFLSPTSLIDLKVSRKGPDKNDVLQVLIYQILLSKSTEHKNKKINIVEIFNPRLQMSYEYDVRFMKREYYYHLHDAIYS